MLSSPVGSYYRQGSASPARVRSPGPIWRAGSPGPPRSSSAAARSPRSSSDVWVGSTSVWPRQEVTQGSSLLRRRTASGSTSPDAMLSKSYESCALTPAPPRFSCAAGNCFVLTRGLHCPGRLMADIDLHRPLGESRDALRLAYRSSGSPARSAGGASSPRRSPYRSAYAERSPRARSPRVPSSSFYRPVGSPVARTIFPARRGGSVGASRSPGTQGASVCCYQQQTRS
jgi:hypothetical protein